MVTRKIESSASVHGAGGAAARAFERAGLDIKTEQGWQGIRDNFEGIAKEVQGAVPSSNNDSVGNVRESKLFTRMEPVKIPESAEAEKVLRTWQELDRFSIVKTGEPAEMPPGFDTWASDLKQEWMDRKYKDLEGGQSTPETSIVESNEQKVEPGIVSQQQNPELPQESGSVPTPEPQTMQEEQLPPTSLVPENVPQPEKTLEEEYAELAKIRDDLAKTEALKNNFSTDTGVKIEELRAKYDDQKDRISEIVAGDIAKKYGWNSPDEVPEDRKNDFKKEVRGVLFDKLIQEEGKSYKDTLKANKERTVLDKTLEVAREALNTKVAQWYLGLSRKQRMALNFGIGTVVGLTFSTTLAPGALGALSYASWRAARVGFSAGAGAKAGEWANKKWSLEELNANHDKEIEDLKNSDLSWEEKSKGLEDIEQKYKKEKMIVTAKRLGVTAGAGLGTGFLSNFAEHAFTMTGGGSSSVMESKFGKGDIQDHKFARGKFDPNAAQKDLAKIMSPKLSVGNQSSINVRPEVRLEAPEISPRIEPENIKVTLEKPEVPLEQVFKPEVLTQEAGGKTDSVWKMLKNVLENSERFKKLGGSGTPEEIAKQIEARQTRVLQGLVNEVLENHEKYGVGENGEIVIGQKVDFSELFKDGKKLNEILADAENLKPATIKDIVENNAKIATYLREHKGFKLTKDSVNEILNTKPKAEVLSTSPVEQTDIDLESVKTGMNAEDIKNELGTSGTEDGILVIKPKPKYAEFVNADDVTNTGQESSLEKALSAEIAEAKQKLKIPEESNNLSKQSAGGLRNLRTMPEDIAMQAQIKKVLDEVINNVYEKKGVLGFGRMEGVKSAEWNEMRKLPAWKVFDFYKNPEGTKLPVSIVESLKKSVKHRNFFETIKHIVETEAGGDIKPFERDDDTMEIFAKRLANFVVSHNTPNKSPEVLKMAA
jgi:hypothetical protein